jgi:SET and MYND domain-containing protein
MPIGACVSPVVALINHSCDPNAVVVFPRAGGELEKDKEPLMQVIALKYIAPDEEVCFFSLSVLNFIFYIITFF